MGGMPLKKKADAEDAGAGVEGVKPDAEGAKAAQGEAVPEKKAKKEDPIRMILKHQQEQANKPKVEQPMPMTGAAAEPEAAATPAAEEAPAADAQATPVAEAEATPVAEAEAPEPEETPVPEPDVEEAPQEARSPAIPVGDVPAEATEAETGAGHEHAHDEL
jgi:S-DNA-T family DNA segregation ATPase FtsK/SpoIIIE